MVRVSPTGASVMAHLPYEAVLCLCRGVLRIAELAFRQPFTTDEPLVLATG